MTHTTRLCFPALAWLLVLPSLTLVAPAAAEVELPVKASSVYDPRYLPELAVDGDPRTRWASSGAGDEWLLLDLGASVAVRTLTLNWEHAYALAYRVELSEDAETWQALVPDGKGVDGQQALEGLEGRGRYLRIYCTRPGPFPLYSLWEISSADGELARALKALGMRFAEARAAAAKAAAKRLSEVVNDLGVEEIVFAVRKPGVDGHWYANFGHYARSVSEKCYRTGASKLCALNVKTGTVRVILEDAEGSLRDPVVHYGGQKVLFSYLKAGTEHYHLYEIGVDGTGLKQLTDGDWDDLEPTYLPDGGIVFVSSRCNRWVNCWLTPVAALCRCDGDGGNVRMLSANVEHDNTPWVLPDGRVLYMRWEYVDRSQVHYHHLWTTNPDGTEQSVFYGNLHPGVAMLDAKPIPGTEKVVSIFSPGHGQHEHQGQVTIVDPGDGPDNQSFAKAAGPDTNFRDPYPLSENVFLVARGAELLLMDAEGNTHAAYQLPGEDVAQGLWCHEPRLIAPHARERVIAPMANLTKATGRLLLTDVYRGRNMAGVNRGDIKKLLVLESLPKPINYTGGMDPLTYGGTFTLERVVGTVPVEPDGSAYFELPALRAFFFVALDENDDSVKRMQSFLTVQPGETTSCVGCHENRTDAVAPRTAPAALRRAPSQVTPIDGIPEVFDFPRDIQPILDRHCVTCHDYDAHGEGKGPHAGGVILTGDRGPIYSHSYYALTLRRQFVDGRNDPKSNLPPRSIGAVASPLMAKLKGDHHGVRADPHEVGLVRYWVESGAVYPGTYGALGSGSIGGYYANGLVETDFDWPETKAAGEAVDRRCASCHQGPKVLPKALSDERDVSFWRPDWDDPRLRLARHAVFNLTRPDKSLLLLAPLAAEAGGYGLCRDASGTPVFRTTADADYRKLLAVCEAGKRRLDDLKRFDMPGFRPPEPYLREMARYGVLGGIPEPDARVDPYALDRAYWQSLWWVPPRGSAATKPETALDRDSSR
jgi:mono/diheme cytochrome c family protein